MNSTLNRISLINHKLLSIGELPASYLVSMTYEEQLLWLCNYLETQLLPKINELITTFNNDTEILENAINDIIDLTNELRQEMIDLKDEIYTEVDNKLEEFMTRIADDLESIANEILEEKIQNGELMVSLGLDYNSSTEALTFFINSETSSELIEDLSELTTPEGGE